MSARVKISDFFEFVAPPRAAVQVEFEKEAPKKTSKQTLLFQKNVTVDDEVLNSKPKRKASGLNLVDNEAKRLTLKKKEKEVIKQKNFKREQEAIANSFRQHLQLEESNRRIEELIELNDTIQKDDELALFSTVSESNSIMRGKGPVDANLMVIFLQPTRAETETKCPFSSGYAKIVLDRLRDCSIDIDRHCYLTYLMKIKVPGGKDPTMNQVDSHLTYLRREIEIIRPKVILCFGRIVSSLAAECFLLNDNVAGYELDAGVWSIKTQSLFSLSAVTAARFDDFQHVSRVKMMEDPHYYMTLGEHSFDSVNKKKEWRDEFTKVKDLMFQHAAHCFDPIKSLNDDFEKKGQGNIFQVAERMGIEFIDPQESVLFERSDFHVFDLPRDYFGDLKRNGHPLRLYLSMCRFDKFANTYTLFSRSKEGFSCAVRVENPTFRFWIEHVSFERVVQEDGIVDFRLIPAKRIQQQVEQLLLTNAHSMPHYKNFSDAAILHRFGVKIEYDLKRPYMYYHKFRKRFLRIEYRESSILTALKNILATLFPTHATYEASTKPDEFIFFDRNLYMYGWFEIPAEKLRFTSPVTICDLECTVDYADLVGFSPNVGQSVKPEDETHAPLRFLNLDGEMLNSSNERMPEPESDPIIRLCGSLVDLNPVGRSSVFEVQRHQKEKKKREVLATGRTNVVHQIEFILGPHEKPKADVFKPSVLPRIPSIPETLPLAWDEAKGDAFLQSLYDWNQFIKNTQNWIGYVGRYRAKRLFNSKLTCKYFIGGILKQCPKDTTKELYDEWKKRLRKLNGSWNTRKKDSDLDLPENQPPIVLIDPVEIGSIEATWSVYHPTPIALYFSSERDLLLSFAEYVRAADFDVILGHNICGFDIDFIVRRMRVLNLYWNDIVPHMGNSRVSLSRGLMTAEYQTEQSLNVDRIRTKKLETRANGARVFKLIDIPGRDTLDTLHYAQRDIPGLPGFDLSTMAKETIGDTKHDVPHTSIKPLFYNNPKKLTDYCTQDMELCDRTVNFRNAVQYVVATCRLIGAMCIGQYYTTGVQVKIVYKLIRRFRVSGLNKILADKNIHSEGSEKETTFNYYDLEDFDEDEDDEEEVVAAARARIAAYKGATCIDIQSGFYTDPTISLDFGSLYPNIMKKLNSCASVMGTLMWLLLQGIPEERLNSSDLKFPDPQNNNEPTQFYSIEPQKLSEADARQLPEFDDQPAGLAQCIKNADGTYTPKLEIGDLIAVVTEVLDSRALVKSKMNGLDSSSEEYKKLDAQQLGLKVIANSTYGATGVSSGKLAAKWISAWVTKYGRERLEIVRNLLVTYYQAFIVGGDTDSVFPQFPRVKKPDDIYAVHELRENIRDENSPLVKKRFIDHVLYNIQLLMPANIKMIMEFLYLPFAVQKKKHQTGGKLMLKKNPATGKQEFENGNNPIHFSKGTEETRRSTAPFAARALKKVDKLLIKYRDNLEEGKRLIVEYVRSVVADVIEGRVNDSEFVMSRYYGKTDYADEKNAVLQICNLARARGEPVPELGTRVRFVVVQARKGAKFYEKVEDPIYAMRNKMRLDLGYYIEKHLRVPILRITNLVDPGLDKLMFGELPKFARNLLQNDPLKPYVKTTNQCLYCQSPSGQKHFCPDCDESRSKIEMEVAVEGMISEAKVQFEESQKHCYECVGMEPGQTIICDNVRCKRWGRRNRAGLKVEELKNILKSIWE